MNKLVRHQSFHLPIETSIFLLHVRFTSSRANQPSPSQQLEHQVSISSHVLILNTVKFITIKWKKKTRASCETRGSPLPRMATASF